MKRRAMTRKQYERSAVSRKTQPMKSRYFVTRIQHRFAFLAFTVVLAASLPVATLAEPGEIKGQDVMGDRNKSANDGWSQAPVPREESAAKDAPNPGGNSTKGVNANPRLPDAGSSNNGPTDPYQTLDHRTPGPAGQSPASPTK